MSNRKRLARERLEYYLVYLILAYRRLILIVGSLLLVYAIATIFINRIGGFVVLLPAIFLILLGNSYNTVVYTARLGAWIATLWRNDDRFRYIHQHGRQKPNVQTKSVMGLMLFIPLALFYHGIGKA